MRRLSLLCAAAILLTAPAPVIAQGTAFGSLGAIVGQEYQFNIFATPPSFGKPATDMVTRLGPIAEAGYRSDVFAIFGRYEASAERFWRHPELNRTIGRQDGAAQLMVRPSRAMEIGVNGSYMDTFTPLDLSTPDAIVLGRVHAERLAARPELLYDWRRARFAFDIEFAREILADTAAANIQTGNVRLELHSGPRMDYAFSTLR